MVDALRDEHEIVSVGRSSGDLQADIADADALRGVLEQVAPFDAVICAAGQAAFDPLGALGDDDFALSLNSKLMGQINMVRYGLPHISDEGSFTLTSGVLSHEPMPGSAAVSTVNAGLEGFVRAAALEMPRGVRMNVVSPPWVSETLDAMGRDPGEGQPAAAVARLRGGPPGRSQRGRLRCTCLCVRRGRGRRHRRCEEDVTQDLVPRSEQRTGGSA